MTHDEIIDVLVGALKVANTSPGPNDFRPLIIATEAVCHELDRIATALELLGRLS
jgi:hypothetical protein